MDFRNLPSSYLTCFLYPICIFLDQLYIDIDIDIYIYISGWWFQPSWKILVNGKDYPIYYGKKRSKPPTSIYYPSYLIQSCGWDYPPVETAAKRRLDSTGFLQCLVVGSLGAVAGTRWHQTWLKNPFKTEVLWWENIVKCEKPNANGKLARYCGIIWNSYQRHGNIWDDMGNHGICMK